MTCVSELLNWGAGIMMPNDTLRYENLPELTLTIS